MKNITRIELQQQVWGIVLILHWNYSNARLPYLMLSGFIKNMDNSKNLCLGIVSANYSYNKLKEECIINSGRALQEIFTPIRVFILYRVRETGINLPSQVHLFTWRNASLVSMTIANISSLTTRSGEMKSATSRQSMLLWSSRFMNDLTVCAQYDEEHTLKNLIHFVGSR